MSPWRCVRDGRDFLKAPLFGLFFGGIYTAGGLFILATLTLLGPALDDHPHRHRLSADRAIHRRRPLRGQPAHLLPASRCVGGEILSVIIRQRERQFGWMAFVILCIFWIWLFQFRILFAIFLGAKSMPGILGFFGVVAGTAEGLGFLAIGTVIGAILCYVLFSATVTSIPLLLDRDVDVITAVITSFKTVRQNRTVMVGWGIVILLLAVLAMVPAFLGLLLVLPVLGHATWHLYEKAIGPPEQELE